MVNFQAMQDDIDKLAENQITLKIEQEDQRELIQSNYERSLETKQLCQTYKAYMHNELSKLRLSISIVTAIVLVCTSVILICISTGRM